MSLFFKSLIFSLNDSSDTNGNVDFTYDVNIVSQNCSLIINDIVNSTQQNITGENVFSGVIFQENQTISWSVNCSTLFTSGISDLFLLNINITEGIPEIDERFKVGSCPDSLQDIFLLGLFVVIALFFIVLGIIEMSFFGIFGAIILFFVGG